MVLHGIFDSGRNWASVARRLVRRRPEWGVLLVDLWLHGASRVLSPPHTIVACTADVDRLVGGHWVNADNPDALVALLADGLPERFTPGVR